MRSVVVFPQPEGPSSAKNEPRGISSERSSTATTPSNRLVTFSIRTSAATVRSSATLATGAVSVLRGPCSPVVELLAHVEVEERLGRRDAVEPAQPVGDVEQVPAVGADDLDEQVELPGREDDVVRLGP